MLRLQAASAAHLVALKQCEEAGVSHVELITATLMIADMAAGVFNDSGLAGLEPRL